MSHSYQPSFPPSTHWPDRGTVSLPCDSLHPISLNHSLSKQMCRSEWMYKSIINVSLTQSRCQRSATCIYRAPLFLRPSPHKHWSISRFIFSESNIFDHQECAEVWLPHDVHNSKMFFSVLGNWISCSNALYRIQAMLGRSCQNKWTCWKWCKGHWPETHHVCTSIMLSYFISEMIFFFFFFLEVDWKCW